MKTNRTRAVIWGVLFVVLCLFSIQTLINAEQHFGEYILYFLTLLSGAACASCIIGDNSPLLHSLRKAARIVFIFFAAGFVLLLFACRTDKVTYKEKYSIVLGAPVRETKVSLILDRRIQAAADFLRKDRDAVAVLTGGNSPYEGENGLVSAVTTEGAYMTMALMAEGIDSDRLYLENEATSTVENFLYSTDILRDIGYENGDEIVIITNRFHSYRVRLLAKKAGIKNFRIFSAHLNPTEAVTWYLREIPISLLHFIKNTFSPAKR